MADNKQPRSRRLVPVSTEIQAEFVQPSANIDSISPLQEASATVLTGQTVETTAVLQNDLDAVSPAKSVPSPAMIEKATQSETLESIFEDNNPYRPLLRTLLLNIAVLPPVIVSLVG